MLASPAENVINNVKIKNINSASSTSFIQRIVVKVEIKRLYVFGIAQSCFKTNVLFFEQESSKKTLSALHIALLVS